MCHNDMPAESESQKMSLPITFMTLLTPPIKNDLPQQTQKVFAKHAKICERCGFLSERCGE